MKSETYLTTEELSKRIKYDPRTIRNCLKDTVLVEGIHYFRPFGGRRILFVWETIERDMRKVTRSGTATSRPEHSDGERKYRSWVAYESGKSIGLLLGLSMARKTLSRAN